MDKKKLFALASFSAVAGVFVAASAAGCSSSSTTTTTTDAGTDAKKPPPPPPPPGDDGSTGDDGGMGTCPVTTPVDLTSLPYEDPAPVKMNACSDADVTKFTAAISTAKNDDELKAMISASCAACIFTDANKTGWGPLPETNTSSGNQAITVNVGGCYQLVTGSKDCGKSYQNLIDCGFTACDGCPSGDQTAFSNCLKKADTGACKDAVKAYQTACGAVDMNTYTNAQNNCEPSSSKYLFEGPINVQCVNGITAAEGGGG